MNDMNKKLSYSHRNAKILSTLVLFATLAVTSHATVFFSYSFAGNNSFNFTYGNTPADDWSNFLLPGPTYLEVGPGASSEGGGGVGFASVDTTFYPNNRVGVVITAEIGNSHQASDIRVVVSTNSSNFYVWSIPATVFSSLTTYTLWLDPTTPVFTQGTLDYSDITSIQFQGDYFSGNTNHYMLYSIELIPEPSSCVLFLAMGVLALAFFKSRKISHPTAVKDFC